MVKQRRKRRRTIVHLNTLTATTLREVYAQSLPETQSFLPYPHPQDRCSYRHSPRSRGGPARATAGISLESTIITPWHASLSQPGDDPVYRAEFQVSESVPATTGLIDGRAKIGLEPHELEWPTECKNKPPKRDTGVPHVFKRDSETICSATLVFVALAGIKVRPNVIFSITRFNLTFLQVFATGGCTVRLN